MLYLDDDPTRGWQRSSKRMTSRVWRVSATKACPDEDLAKAGSGRAG